MKKIRRFFHSKKLVHSEKYAPAEFVKIFTHGNTRYVRIAFTNKQKVRGFNPTTDIRWCDVAGFRKLPSPFKVWLYGLFNRKAKATFYTIKK